MKEFFLFLTISLPLALLGFSLFKAAKWSRQKNKRLKETADSTRERIIENMKINGISKENITRYYCSSVTKSEELIGKSLAVAVIVFIIAFFIFVFYVLYLRN